MDSKLITTIPQGFVLAEEGQIFPQKTRVHIVATFYGETKYHDAIVYSCNQAKGYFRTLFKAKYPETNPPPWKDIRVYYEKAQTTPAPAHN